MARLEWTYFDRLAAHLRKLADPEPTPLMKAWEKIITEDNRLGVLAGLDKHGLPMRPVTYRPARSKSRGAAPGPRGLFTGLGPQASSINNNLTSAEYRHLSGPPLATRGSNSRVIANLSTRHGRAPSGYLHAWVAEGSWPGVVSVRGIPFLAAHFHGINLPTRDLTGVRPRGREQAVSALRLWSSRWLNGA